MIVRRYDKHSLIVGMKDKYVLQTVQNACDGKKVRSENKVIIPNQSVEKLTIFETPDAIGWKEDTYNVYLATKKARMVRVANVEKIKSQSGKDIRFDYNYRGSYDNIMDHQKILYNLMTYTNGCALLADPGLGKTGPSLWGIDTKIEKGLVKRALYITLSSLKDNVRAEALTEIPHRTAVVLKSSAHADKVLNKKYKSDKKNVDYDIYIANYESMTGLTELFLSDFFDMVVLDEVQRIGNPKSQQTKAIIKKFENVKYKYIMTGTLNANNLMSFFMPFRFMGASFVPYANYYTYRKEYMIAVDPDERIWRPKAGAVDATSVVIGRNSVTFKVDECLDMPDVKYNKLICPMEGDQAVAYEKAKKDMLVYIDGLCMTCEDVRECELYACRRDGKDCTGLPCTNNQAVLSSNLIQAKKLHQIASGFYINSWTDVDDEGNETKQQEIFDMKSNPKHKLIMDTIDTIPENEKVILFGSYTHSIKTLAEALAKKYGKDSVISCYGSDDAFAAVEKFKEKGKRFLIGNQTKIGTGLNIQFSRYQLYIQNSFSFVQREQSVGRQWRKGQKGTVVVYDFVTEGSIDEHVMNVLAGKKDLSLTLEQWSKILQ